MDNKKISAILWEAINSAQVKFLKTKEYIDKSFTEICAKDNVKAENDAKYEDTKTIVKKYKKLIKTHKQTNKKQSAQFINKVIYLVDLGKPKNVVGYLKNKASVSL